MPLLWTNIRDSRGTEMVKTHSLLVTLFAMFILIAFVDATFAAWEGTYHLEHEWVEIWIKQNGTIDLFYNITIKLDSGDDINYVYIGQPKRDFEMGKAMDQYGHTLVALTRVMGKIIRLMSLSTRP